jgi:hypothetical protein
MIVINREAPCNYTLCLPESLLYISPKIALMDEQQALTPWLVTLAPSSKFDRRIPPLRTGKHGNIIEDEQHTKNGTNLSEEDKSCTTANWDAPA